MELSDINGNVRDGTRKFAALYIDSSEKIGQAILELCEKSTTWARQTALEPLFDAQRSAGKQILQNSIALARKMWGVDKEEMASQP